MSRIRTLAMATMIATAALAAFATQTTEAPTSDVGPPSAPEMIEEVRQLCRDGLPELHYGVFSGHLSTAVDPAAFIWSYDDAGTQVEVWALYRPGTTNGWEFPGPNALSVDVTIDYEGASSTVASLTDFANWCIAEHPNATSSSDFEFHEHRVTVVIP